MTKYIRHVNLLESEQESILCGADLDKLNSETSRTGEFHQYLWLQPKKSSGPAPDEVTCHLCKALLRSLY